MKKEFAIISVMTILGAGLMGYVTEYTKSSKRSTDETCIDEVTDKISKLEAKVVDLINQADELIETYGKLLDLKANLQNALQD